MVIFREPDGRTDVHSAEDNVQHQSKVTGWMESLAKNGNISGGRALTLTGTVVEAKGRVREDIYKVGKEIVGGYLLLKSDDLRQATELIKSCPILERGGFAEVREVM